MKVEKCKLKLTDICLAAWHHKIVFYSHERNLRQTTRTSIYGDRCKQGKELVKCFVVLRDRRFEFVFKWDEVMSLPQFRAMRAEYKSEYDFS